ncbi:mandelate racemase [Mycolicibacterium cyprinidarum]|nr:mandelate racemase [Mycolicibacterium sp. NGTWS1803]
MTSSIIEHLDIDSYTVPTPGPEADGTLQWDSTTAVVVHAHAGDRAGVGWTYSSPAAACVITEHLATVVVGRESADVTDAWQAMHRACRNLGTRGLVMQAISAVDIALWDLKAQLCELPLVEMFGQTRAAAPIYGSGGFTNLDDDELGRQVAEWQRLGCTAMKIKIGQSWGGDVGRDLQRVNRLRELVGNDIDLMVDANGAYTQGQARRVGAALDDLGVVWFEEPVSSDDVAGLDELRHALRCDVTAGEYVADLYDARRLITVLDCLQLDATRCGGYSGWLAGVSLAGAHNLQVSAHCAPALHAPVATAIPNLRHIEYFVDHARLEPLLFEGVPEPADGQLRPQGSQPGHGMTLAGGADRYRHA